MAPNNPPTTLTRGQTIARGTAMVAGAAAGFGVGIIGGMLINDYFNTLAKTDIAKGTGSFKFPLDLGNYGFMSFAFQKYSFGTGSALFGQTKIESAGNIFLPIPNNLRDNTSVQYQELSVLDTLTKAGGSLLSSNAGAAQKTALTEGVNRSTTSKIFAGLTNAATPDAIALGLAQASGGLAVNPFMAVLFKNPTFKSHAFTWKLIPRDSKESGEIKGIINAFKKNMLPGRDPTGALFTYPSLVQVRISNQNNMYAFKPAVIKSFDVNFASAGTPSFHQDQTPTSVDITVQLQEIEYWLNEDDFTKDNSQQTRAPSGAQNVLTGISDTVTSAAGAIFGR